MADLAQKGMRAKRKEAELQQREDLTLAREDAVRRKSALAMESHKDVAEKVKRFEKQVETVTLKTRETILREERDLLEKKQETQDELARMREEAHAELVKKREDADLILMEKIRKLEEQREANRRELAEHLGDPGAYLERQRAELADREAELGVQVARRDAQQAAREHEFAEWEDRLQLQEQQLLAERWEFYRFREEMQKRISRLDDHSG